ncbi:DNA polymerase Y family protein [Mesorhizobium sp. YIM 152430]|uniref:Y-family DNA polymerase n=1 Tax=Mesorhizobium sp. YIM 152430 TaxID=3031761 RepID=UPI0023D9E56A|nr:DNA polymerase Y family protein [Mesorhizobium sp. YIM 152430]MDF1600921.1 DNA polymerase Y family protein [Mesorhizobium sp. YIM 152430]
MARVISVYLPKWPIDRLRRTGGDVMPASDRPFVVAGSERNRQVVTAATDAACAAGIRVGMPLTKARVLVPGLVVENADPAADAQSLKRLALWLLQRFSPVVAVDPPDGIVVESTGSDHLHGGEAAMLDAIVGRLAMSGIAAKVAIADTWGAAHALARFRRETIVVANSAHGPQILEPLPLWALRIDDATAHGLVKLGFRTVGDVLAQPRAPLVRRFGTELGRRIDHALGQAVEPIEPLRPDDIVEVRRSFAEPIGAAETIARYVGKLVVALCMELDRRGLGARRLDLVCHRVDSGVEAVRVGTATPVRDVKRLTRLLCDKIETIAPGFGIELMTIAATVAEPLHARQSATTLIETAPTDISNLIDVLSNRIGERGVYRFAAVASDVPERSVQRISPLAADTGSAWPDHWPRPSRLLLRPEVIETMALLPDHPPAWFSWRGIRRRIKRADGPERVFGEWWRADAELVAVRDYFRVEDDAGERFWVYRAGDGENAETGSHRWFMHGIFG